MAMHETPELGMEEVFICCSYLKVRQPRIGIIAAQMSVFEPTPQHEA